MNWFQHENMASFTKEKILVFIFTLTYITGSFIVDGKGTVQGDKVIFSPLRQGSNYTLEKSKSDWFLASFGVIAEAVVLSVNYSPPYGKIQVLLFKNVILVFGWKAKKAFAVVIFHWKPEFLGEN